MMEGNDLDRNVFRLDLMSTLIVHISNVNNYLA